MSDCRFGVSPVNYPDPDPDPVACVLPSRKFSRDEAHIILMKNVWIWVIPELSMWRGLHGVQIWI